MENNIDDHKLMFHPERVVQWKKTGDCFPIYVEIGPTNRCNHKCMFCALDWLEHGGVDIDTKILHNCLEDMAKSSVQSVMFAGEGEPLLHKDIDLFVKQSKKFGMSVSMTTNGVLFKKERAEELLPYFSWIRFSVDAGYSKTYSELHGTIEGDFDKVIKNINAAAEIKARNNYNVTIGVQALLTNKNLNELVGLANKLKEIGASNLQVKPYSHHPASKNDLRFNFEEAEQMRDDLEKISDKNFQVIYRTNTIKRLNQERDYQECYGLPFFALIDARGNVIPCGLFYNNIDFTYGNLYKQDFSAILKSKMRKEVIRKITEKGIDACRLGCRLDACNRYLHRLKHPEPHDNFI